MFSHLLGHEAQKAYLEKVLTNQSLAHAYCFSGPRGVGKASVARAMFEKLLEISPIYGGDGPKGQRGLATHPDFSLIESTDGSIPVDAIRDLRDRLAMSSFGDGWKLILIDGADSMNTAAQNALLKTLEEPRGKTLMILIAHDITQLLPTILSRVVHVRFTALPQETICKALKEKGMDPEIAHTISRWSGGAPGEAFSLLEESARADWRALQTSTREFLHLTAPHRLKMIDAWTKEAKDDRATLFSRFAHIRFLLREALAEHPSKEKAHAIKTVLATEASLRENGNIAVCLAHLAFNI